ncbi:MAG TPA: archease [Thermoguttaceae bacterium]|nr:archease [Thermoguttaceae bacterium]
MFEIFEHTADLGIRIEADSFAALLVEAAKGLTSVLVANPEAIEPAREVALTIRGSQPEELLVDWLSELLYRFGAEHLLFARFEVTHQADHVAARLWGEAIDPARHRLDTEVKAITYHRLKVEEHEGRWRGEVIVDL